MKKLHMLQGTSLDRLVGGVLDEGSDKGSMYILHCPKLHPKCKDNHIIWDKG